jgi:hypothetical protein
MKPCFFPEGRLFTKQVNYFLSAAVSGYFGGYATKKAVLPPWLHYVIISECFFLFS